MATWWWVLWQCNLSIVQKFTYKSSETYDQSYISFLTFSKGKPDWPRVFDDDLVWKFTCDGLNSHLLRGHYYLSLQGPNVCQRPLKDHVLIEKFLKWLIYTTLTVWSTSTWFLYAFASVLGNSAFVSLAHQKISKCQDDAKNKVFVLTSFSYTAFVI